LARSASRHPVLLSFFIVSGSMLIFSDIGM